ncbi:MAG: VIT family protein [Caulobacteraceae bacterium]|nr:MAG: VIT family protein [Caulobacteraceae bacterium]
MRRSPHLERHIVGRVGWLRAAVLGANDGIVSTASLIVGVAAAEATRSSILIAGVAGLVAGALSMAAGEYVSVSSQADAETADMDRERQELATSPEAELRELAGFYVARGLTEALADEVAAQLTAKDALAAHARDELGISALTTARPIQAALASAAAFSVGAAMPLLVAWVAPIPMTVWLVTAAAIVSLAILGGIGARVGGAAILKPVLRVTLWGVIAMAVTAGIGRLFGAVL